jgi:hypothetical protein
VPQLRFAGEARARRGEPAAALDPHGSCPRDHQLVDRRVAQQRLERAEPDRALGHPRGQRGPRLGIEDAGLALHERADPGRGIVPVARVAGALDQLVAQRAGERIEGIGWVHAAY